MDRNFSDPSEPYARLRRVFVYKEKPSHTPLHLARHRTHPAGAHIPGIRPLPRRGSTGLYGPPDRPFRLRP